MISTAMKYMTSSAFFVSYLEKLSIKHLEKKEKFKKTNRNTGGQNDVESWSD